MNLAPAVIAACALGACGFDLKLGGEPLDGGGSGSDGDVDTMTIDTPVAPVACSAPSMTGLVACFELEDDVTDGTLRDSSPAHADATTVGLEATQRTKPATSAAANVTNLVATYVPDSPSLDLAAAYTVAMWIRPNSVPPTSRVFGLYDHELQYAATIAKTGGSIAQLRCINTSQNYVGTNYIPINTWSFIACTWDGETLCAHYWSTPTDHERLCGIPSGVAEQGSRGLAIGHLSNNGSAESPLDGSFDSVQVYSRALATSDLCATIGESPSCF